MKRFLPILFMIFVTVVWAPGARSQIATFSFDEFGNGIGPSGEVIVGSLAQDPFSGITTMRYALPFFCSGSGPLYI